MQHLCTHLTHSWFTVCSGHIVPGDTGVVRGEALRDALVPVPWWTSTCDGSRVLSLGPLLCGMEAVILISGWYYWFVDNFMYHSTLSLYYNYFKCIYLVIIAIIYYITTSILLLLFILGAFICAEESHTFSLFHSWFTNMYNLSMYVYLSFSVPRTSSARSMLRAAQTSVQEACCLDIGFRHMSSAPDCVAFSWCMRRVAEEREPLHSFE